MLENEIHFMSFEMQLKYSTNGSKPVHCHVPTQYVNIGYILYCFAKQMLTEELTFAHQVIR